MRLFLKDLASLPARFVKWWQQTFKNAGVLGKLLLGCSTTLFACCLCSFSFYLIAPRPEPTEETLSQAVNGAIPASITPEISPTEAIIEDPVEPSAMPTDPLPVEPTIQSSPTATPPPTLTATATVKATLTATPTIAATATAIPTIEPSFTATTTPESSNNNLSWNDGLLEQVLASVDLEISALSYNPNNRTLLILYINKLQDEDVCSAPFEIEHRYVQFIVNSLLKDGYPPVTRVFIEQIDDQGDLLSALAWNVDEDRIMYDGPELFLERCRN